MKKLTTLIFLFGIFSFNLSAQSLAEDFTFTDLNGNSHSLYADYLDQGKSVFISIGAAWNMWDSAWVGTNVMNEFHNEFVGEDAVLLFLEVDGFTDDDALYGNSSGSNPQYYDLVTGNDFPIINVPEADCQAMIEDYDIAWYPTIRIICPDGTMTGDHINNTDLHWGVFDEPEVIADNMFLHCGTLFSDKNALISTVFADENMDCELQSGETLVADVGVRIEGPNGFTIKYTNDLGEARALLDAGSYDISVDVPNAHWSTCNSPQIVDFASGGEIENLNLGLTANTDCTYLTIAASSPRFRRCFDSQIYVDFCNEGTISSVNTLVDVLLGEHLEYVSSTIPVQSQNGQTLTFNVGDLASFECGGFTIDVLPNCDIDLGTIQCVEVSIYPTEACDYATHQDRFCQELVGAYDPNDKRAFPYHGSNDYKTLPDETLRYMIRFQNTGTDTAFNVVIVDEISELLDLSSFRKLNSSHPCEVEINEAREMRFIFDNIMLPDSFVNEPASNGFVTFTIAMEEGLSNGTLIENTAGIFFDFNDAVVTNTTKHEVDDGILSVDDILNPIFRLSPNPANEVLNIDMNANAGGSHIAKIYSLNGALVSTHLLDANTKHQVNLSSFNSGVYILRLTNENGRSLSQKFAVQH